MWLPSNASQPDVASTCLWLQKEASLKLHGTGIIFILQDVLLSLFPLFSLLSFSLHTSFLSSLPIEFPMRFQTLPSLHHGYVLTIVSEE